MAACLGCSQARGHADDPIHVADQIALRRQGALREPLLKIPRQGRRFAVSAHHGTETLQESQVSGADSAGSSSMVSAILHSR